MVKKTLERVRYRKEWVAAIERIVAYHRGRAEALEQLNFEQAEAHMALAEFWTVKLMWARERLAKLQQALMQMVKGGRDGSTTESAG